jgi:hypothetical protein
MDISKALSRGLDVKTKPRDKVIIIFYKNRYLPKK